MARHPKLPPGEPTESVQVFQRGLGLCFIGKAITLGALKSECAKLAFSEFFPHQEITQPALICAEEGCKSLQ